MAHKNTMSILQKLHALNFSNFDIFSDIYDREATKITSFLLESTIEESSLMFFAYLVISIFDEIVAVQMEKPPLWTRFWETHMILQTHDFEVSQICE